MSLKALSADECRVVFACLAAAAHGPFFDDQEFHTLIGLDRREVAVIAADAPDIDDADENVRLAINNSLNNLLWYPHREGDAWKSLIPASPEEVWRIFNKWRGGDGPAADRAYGKG